MTTQYGTSLIPPTTGADYASLLATCDPALYGLSAAFKAELNSKLSTAYSAAAKNFSETSLACQDLITIGDDPGQEIASRTWNGPALAMWRESESWTQRTTVWDGCESSVRCLYILPPLTREFRDRLAHIRVAVIRTLRAFIEKNENGAGVRLLTPFGISELWLTEVEYGSYEIENGQQSHLVVRFKLVMKEREMPNTTGLSDLSTVETSIDIKDDSGNVTDFVQTSFDATP